MSKHGGRQWRIGGRLLALFLLAHSIAEFRTRGHGDLEHSTGNGRSFARNTKHRK